MPVTGDFRRQPQKGYIIKDDDYKKVYVTLVSIFIVLSNVTVVRKHCTVYSSSVSFAEFLFIFFSNFCSLYLKLL